MPVLSALGIDLSFWFCLLFASLAVRAQDSSTDPSDAVARWAHSTAVAGRDGSSSPNNTLYIYGGNRAWVPNQQDHTWSRELLRLSLSDSWSASEAPLELVTNDTSPATALGALWSSADGSRLLYWGGQASDSPDEDPPEPELWAFDVSSEEWETVDVSGDSVVGIAEASVGFLPGAGEDDEPIGVVAFGHVDHYTQPGYSIQSPRAYLDSMLLVDLGAPSFRNQTGLSEGTDSPMRPHADGTISFVPGMGEDEDGILVAIGGGNDDGLLPMDEVGIYHADVSTWSTRKTSGDAPEGRVNHCAVRGTAFVDGLWKSQIFIFGGQSNDLEEQYDDWHALLLPDLRWVEVDMEDSPSERSGHSCTLIGTQMIIIGGWTSKGLGEEAEDGDEESSRVLLYDIQKLDRVSDFDPQKTVYHTPEELEDELGGQGEGTSDGSEACQKVFGVGSGYGTGDESSHPTASRNGDADKSSTGDAETGTSTDGGEIQDTDSPGRGAMAGLIAGLVIAIIALGSGAYFFLRRRQRQSYAGKHQRLESEDDVNEALEELQAMEEAEAQRLAHTQPETVGTGPTGQQQYPPAILQVQPSRPVTIVSPTPQRPVLTGLRWRSSHSSLPRSPDGNSRLSSPNESATSIPNTGKAPADSMGSLGQYETQELSEGQRGLLRRQTLKVMNEDADQEDEASPFRDA